jgi:hypothetical protein
VYSTVTVTPGFSSIKLSDKASHNFSIDVEPASVTVPFKASLCDAFDPHPVIAKAIKQAAETAAITLFFINN